MRKNELNMRKLTIVILTLASLLFLLASTSMPPASAQMPPREKTIIIDMCNRNPAPDNFNPFIIGAKRDNGLHQLCIEYFFYYNLSDGSLLPWLATGYEYKANYTKLVVYLRKGVKWSDGVPFTADDVVFTYNMLLNYAPKLQHSAEVAKYVEKVIKIDDYTVEFHLKGSCPRFIYSWAFPTVTLWGGLPIVPKHIWEGKDPLTFKNNPPVFTGPFKLVSSTETYTRWKRGDDWGATEVLGIRPAFEYAMFVYYGPEEISAMKMASHELDAIHDFLPSTFWDVKKKNPYVETWFDEPPYAYTPALCERYIALNNKKYPWSLKEVRWAISYLLNRTEIIRVGWEDTSFPVRTPLSEIPIMRKWLELPEIKELLRKYNTTEYNPEKAFAIFKKLGFTRGADGIWRTPNGTRLELTIIIPTWEIAGKKAMIVVTKQLREGGIDATFKVLEGPAWEDACRHGLFDAAYVWHCPTMGAYEPYTYMHHFHSKWTAPIGEDATDNWCRFVNATYDKLLDLMEQLPETDPRYKEAFIKAMEIWLDNLPEIPIANSRKMVPHDTYYWVNWPTAKNPWWSPQTWHAYLPLYLGLKPRRIDYTVVYFTKDVHRFRGIDLVWYGPYKAGDAARIPVDDAEFWIRKGCASYTPPTGKPTIPIESLTKALESLEADVNDVKSSIAELRGQLSRLTTITTIAIIEGIVVIILAIALIIAMRRRSVSK